jgi:hypothetical protein
MKKVIASTALILFITVCFGQTINFTGYEYKEKSSSWDWPYSWERTRVPIALDLDHDRIFVDSRVPQVYDVVETLGTTYDQDGNKIVKFQCIDSRGLRCVVKYKNFYDGIYHLYIEFSDRQWVYEMD